MLKGMTKAEGLRGCLAGRFDDALADLGMALEGAQEGAEEQNQGTVLADLEEALEAMDALDAAALAQARDRADLRKHLAKMLARERKLAADMDARGLNLTGSLKTA